MPLNSALQIPYPVWVETDKLGGWVIDSSIESQRSGTNIVVAWLVHGRVLVLARIIDRGQHIRLSYLL